MLELCVEARVPKVTEPTEIAAFGIMSVPALALTFRQGLEPTLQIIAEMMSTSALVVMSRECLRVAPESGYKLASSR